MRNKPRKIVKLTRYLIKLGTSDLSNIIPLAIFLELIIEEQIEYKNCEIKNRDQPQLETPPVGDFHPSDFDGVATPSRVRSRIK